MAALYLDGKLSYGTSKNARTMPRLAAAVQNHHRPFSKDHIT